MNKMKINLNYYNGFIVVLLTFFQLGIMFYYSNFKKDNNMPQEVDYFIPKKVTFNEVFNSLSSVENLRVLEIEDLESEWYTKVLITGQREEIIKVVNELENFEMYNYDITGKEGVLSVIIELYR